MSAPSQVGEVIEAARAAWPELKVSSEQFSRYVADRGASQSPHLLELYLAFACASGEAEAVAILERDYLSKLPHVLERRRHTPVVIDETCQQLRVTLIVRREISNYK